jgi:hypothetical protein
MADAFNKEVGIRVFGTVMQNGMTHTIYLVTVTVIIFENTGGL